MRASRSCFSKKEHGDARVTEETGQGSSSILPRLDSPAGLAPYPLRPREDTEGQLSVVRAKRTCVSTVETALKAEFELKNQFKKKWFESQVGIRKGAWAIRQGSWDR